METRVYKGTNVRAAKGADFAIEGTAASYNVLSNDLGGFREKIAPGAFDLSLSSPDSDVRCLVNHDPSLILGRTRSGTLKVWADSTGLQFRCQLDKSNSAHQSAFASIKRGDLSECSFAFTVPDDGDSWDNAAPPTRTLRRVDLMDVSAVTYPAYGQPGSTQVSARALEHARKAKPTSVRTSGKPRLSYMPSEKIKDDLRRAQAAVIGDLVSADRRELTEAEVSSYKKFMAGKLSEALGKDRLYVTHDDDYVYCVPSEPHDGDVFRVARLKYKYETNGQISLSEYSDTWGDDAQYKNVARMAYRIIEKLADDLKLRQRMRGAAGIFTR